MESLGRLDTVGVVVCLVAGMVGWSCSASISSISCVRWLFDENVLVAPICVSKNAS